MVRRALLGWVRRVCSRPRATLAVCALLTVGAALLAILRLGIQSDTLELFPEDLPVRQNHAAFVEIFPDLETALLVVVDADTPELAREGARTLERGAGQAARPLRRRVRAGGRRVLRAARAAVPQPR